jgi:deoxyribonuclease-2
MLVLLPAAANSLSCVDEGGAAVDWWFLLKHPRWADKSHSKTIGNGKGDTYVYVTSRSGSSGWAEGGATVDSTSSLLGKQLAGIYARSVANYVFYNDQLPNGSWTEAYGHSKGFFAYDAASAFWVQHSIPKFPNFVKDGYLYGSGQMYYGQHAFCMSLLPSALDAAAEVMTYAYPCVHADARARTPD